MKKSTSANFKFFVMGAIVGFFAKTVWDIIVRKMFLGKMKKNIESGVLGEEFSDFQKQANDIQKMFSKRGGGISEEEMSKILKSFDNMKK